MANYPKTLDLDTFLTDNPHPLGNPWQWTSVLIEQVSNDFVMYEVIWDITLVTIYNIPSIFEYDVLYRVTLIVGDNMGWFSDPSVELFSEEAPPEEEEEDIIAPCVLIPTVFASDSEAENTPIFVGVGCGPDINYTNDSEGIIVPMPGCP